MELFTRKDVPEELTWDLTALYSSEAKLNEDMEKIRRLSEEIETDYRGKLSSVETIQACLDKYRELEQIAAIALSYCSLSASVDSGAERDVPANVRPGRQPAELH